MVSKEDLALADIDDVMMIMCKENKKKPLKKPILNYVCNIIKKSYMDLT